MILVSPTIVAMLRVARIGYRRYGRDSGHPARTNSGNCFSLVPAIELHQPLLFEGNDFLHADVLVAS